MYADVSTHATTKYTQIIVKPIPLFFIIFASRIDFNLINGLQTLTTYLFVYSHTFYISGFGNIIPTFR